MVQMFNTDLWLIKMESASLQSIPCHYARGGEWSGQGTSPWDVWTQYIPDLEEENGSLSDLHCGYQQKKATRK